MRIATFNINGAVRRLSNLIEWLAETSPDVVCLQELKTAHDAFPADALADAGYGAVWRGQRAWNGVAILARDARPVLTRDALPGDPADGQARYIEAAVGGVLIGCLYAPNGNPRPGPKFDYKLAWHGRLEAHAADLLAEAVPVVLAGDYNVVPEPRDIYQTTSYDGNALIQPESRAGLPAAARAGLDRRPARGRPRRSDLHVLGLSAEPVAARRRHAARSPAAQPRNCRPAVRGRRRPGRSRPGECQRSCAGVDRTRPVVSPMRKAGHGVGLCPRPSGRNS